MPAQSDAPSVLALGAWLKNSACLLTHEQALWSAPHGDLDSAEACHALTASAEALLRQAEALGRPVAALAHDLHPDFFSTTLAQQLAARLGVPALGVQHHHAHIAALLAEQSLGDQGVDDGVVQDVDDGVDQRVDRGMDHDVGANEPVIGLALDGVGLGTDGQAWGGELLWLHGAEWRRLGQLWPLALPGGDRAAREPWRMAASAWHALGEGAQIVPRLAPQVGATLAGGVQRMLDQGLHCPPTSSAGRWFDAVAGALGLSLRQSHEAEAAQALQAAAERWLARHPSPLQPLQPPQQNELSLATIDVQGRLDLRPLFAQVCERAQRQGVDPVDAADAVDAASALFHCALADALARWAQRAAQAHGVRRVGLGGGCFFNTVLRTRVQQRLQQAGLSVLQAGPRGCGDAALALGQAWVVQRRLRAAPAPQHQRQDHRQDQHQHQPTLQQEDATCA